MPFFRATYILSRFEFAAKHLDKRVKYWGNIVWPDETKTELFGCHNTHHITPKTPYKQ